MEVITVEKQELEANAEYKSVSVPVCAKEIPYKYMDELLNKSSNKEFFELGRINSFKDVTLYDCGCIKDTEVDEKDRHTTTCYDCSHCLLNYSLKNLKLNHARNILQKS